MLQANSQEKLDSVAHIPWQSFFNACTSTRFVSPKAQPWRKSFGLNLHGLACAICNVALGKDQARLARVIPVELGGGSTADNDMLVCESCEGLCKHVDLLTLHSVQSNIPKRLLQRRETALEVGLNHLVPGQASGNKADIRSHLKERWEHPRSTAKILAGKGFGLIAFHRHHIPEVLWKILVAVLRSKVRVLDARLDRNWAALAIHSDDIYTAVEALIDRNVLCQRVGMTDISEKEEATKFARTWWLLGASVSECSSRTINPAIKPQRFS